MSYKLVRFSISACLKASVLIVVLLSIIAHGIRAWKHYSDQRIQVIGLSASLTYAVEYKAVEQALANLCADLDVTKMISPSEQDLINGGYIPQDDMIETMKKPWDVPVGVIPGKSAIIYWVLVTHTDAHPLLFSPYCSL